MSFTRLNDFQLAVLASFLVEEPYQAIQAGWGAGKSFGLGFLAGVAGELGIETLWTTDTGPRIGAVVQPICEDLLGRNGWRWNGDPTKSYWRHPNGTRCWLRAAQMPSTRHASQSRLEGMNVSLVLIDEAQTLTPAVLHTVTGRARKRGSPPRIVVAGLPVAGAWWVRHAERHAGRVLQATSFVNRENLAPEWFVSLETLPADLVEAMVWNRPRPRVGQVYNNWRSAPFPDGNIAVGWRHDPSMRVHLAVDWGYRAPYACLIAEDPGLDADVVFREWHPDDCTDEQLAAHICAVAWPRGRAEPGSGKIPIDDGAADPAGAAVDAHSGEDTIRRFARPPGRGGIGIRLLTTHDPVRVDIENGTRRVRDRILGRDGARRLLCADDLWERGDPVRLGAGRSFRAMIEGLRWPEPGVRGGYVKDQMLDHAADAVRYYHTNFRWFSTAFDDRRPVDLSHADMSYPQIDHAAGR